MERKRKVYTSFHDLSPREYMYVPKGTLESGKPGSFSKIEIQQILISMGVLTLAFSFLTSPLYNFNISIFLYSIPRSFLGILTAFFVHEISHKFMAQRHGLWSEYRMYPKGLLVSLLLAMLTGFVVAVPGAVMFRGDTRAFETGKIAASGPAANISIAIISYVLYLYFFEWIFLANIFGFVCLVNALLGTFNLVPIDPLDGAKVIRWNGIAWALLFILAISISFLIFRVVPLF